MIWKEAQLSYDIYLIRYTTDIVAKRAVGNLNVVALLVGFGVVFFVVDKVVRLVVVVFLVVVVVFFVVGVVFMVVVFFIVVVFLVVGVVFRLVVVFFVVAA